MHGGVFFIPVLPEQRQVCCYFSTIPHGGESACNPYEQPGSEMVCASVSRAGKGSHPRSSRLAGKTTGKEDTLPVSACCRQRRKPGRRERRKDSLTRLSTGSGHHSSPPFTSAPHGGDGKKPDALPKTGHPNSPPFTGGTFAGTWRKGTADSAAESQFPVFFTWSGHGTELPSGAPSSLPFL